MDKLVRLAREALKQQQAKEQPVADGASAPAPIVIEPAAPNARPVYWENADGVILGPAIPEFLAQVGQHFWVIVQYDEAPRWIRSDRLRNKQAFERQVKPIPFERIKEVR